GPGERVARGRGPLPQRARAAALAPSGPARPAGRERRGEGHRRQPGIRRADDPRPPRVQDRPGGRQGAVRLPAPAPAPQPGPGRQPDRRHLGGAARPRRPSRPVGVLAARSRDPRAEGPPRGGAGEALLRVGPSSEGDTSSSTMSHSFTRMFRISMAPNSARSRNGVAFAPAFDLRAVAPLIRCSTRSPVTMISHVDHSPSLTFLFSLLPGTMSNLVPRRKTSLLHFAPGLNSNLTWTSLPYSLTVSTYRSPLTDGS